jgi:hypothetical protein
MPPYENQSLYDMHALLQQFDTLNAAHAPEHLEMWSIQDMKDAASAGVKKVNDVASAAYKKGSDTYTAANQKYNGLATDQEMIDYYFSLDVERKADYLKLVIGTVDFPLADLLKMMSQSSVMKTAMLNTFYPEAITKEKREEVYKAMHPTPPPKQK